MAVCRWASRLPLLPLAVVATVILTSPVAAGGVQAGKVGTITMRSGDVGTAHDSLVVVTLLGGSPTGQPACALNSYWFIRDAKSEIGKQQIAMLMTAKATGKAVAIKGTGACVRWGDGEDIWEIDWAE